MFNFFRKKNRLLGWEPKLFIKILESLNKDEYSHYISAIEEGILEDLRINKQFENFYTFKYNNVLLNKYEIKNKGEFDISNILILNEINNKYVSFSLRLGYGLVLGYVLIIEIIFFLIFKR